MRNPQTKKTYTVFEVCETDLNWEGFDTYEQALAYVNESTLKCVIIGPEGIEDHT